jgi:hypothetical protein
MRPDGRQKIRLQAAAPALRIELPSRQLVKAILHSVRRRLGQGLERHWLARGPE